LSTEPSNLIYDAFLELGGKYCAPETAIQLLLQYPAHFQTIGSKLNIFSQPIYALGKHRVFSIIVREEGPWLVTSEVSNSVSWPIESNWVAAL